MCVKTVIKIQNMTRDIPRLAINFTLSFYHPHGGGFGGPRGEGVHTLSRPFPWVVIKTVLPCWKNIINYWKSSKEEEKKKRGEECSMVKHVTG